MIQRKAVVWVLVFPAFWNDCTARCHTCISKTDSYLARCQFGPRRKSQSNGSTYSNSSVKKMASNVQLVPESSQNSNIVAWTGSKPNMWRRKSATRWKLDLSSASGLRHLGGRSLIPRTKQEVMSKDVYVWSEMLLLRPLAWFDLCCVAN